MDRLASRSAVFRRVFTVLMGTLLPASVSIAQTSERDVPYGTDSKQRLDLSIPSDTGFPTVLFVHGGSLTSGDKSDDDHRHVCAPFVAAGIGCANVNYRLAPAFSWPVQAEDVAGAVAWVRANIASRGGNPDKMFLIGHSSGATLVALIATNERYLAQHGLSTKALRGIVPMGSIMWDDDLEQAIHRHGHSRVEEAFRRDPDNRMYASLEVYLDHWPMRHMRRGLPPFLFLIAETEQEQPPVLKTNRKFVDDARALGNRAEYRVLSGRTHYSAVRRLGEPNDPVFAIIRDFIRRFSRGGQE